MGIEVCVDVDACVKVAVLVPVALGSIVLVGLADKGDGVAVGDATADSVFVSVGVSVASEDPSSEGSVSCANAGCPPISVTHANARIRAILA